MKVCPKCDRDYGDEAGFCLIDGRALVDGDVMPTVAIGAAEPTLVLPQGVAAKSRSKLPLVIAATVGMLVLVAISALLLSKIMQRGNQVRENQNLRKQATSQNATQTPTPRPAS
jgi:hypothetical protein